MTRLYGTVSGSEFNARGLARKVDIADVGIEGTLRGECELDEVPAEMGIGVIRIVVHRLFESLAIAAEHGAKLHLVICDHMRDAYRGVDSVMSTALPAPTLILMS